MRALTRFLGFAFASADLLLEADRNHLKITFALGAARMMLGRDEASLVGTPLMELVAESDRGMVRAMLGGLVPGARCGPSLVRLAGRQGQDGRPALLSACTLPELKGLVSCALVVASPALMREADQRSRDSATGLLSAESFADASAELIRLSHDAGIAATVSLLDLPVLSELTRRSPDTGRALAQKVGDILRANSLDGSAAGRLGETRFGVVHRPEAGDLAEKLGEATRELLGGAASALPVHWQRFAADGEGTLSQEDVVRAVRFAVNRFASAESLEEMPGSLDQALEDLFEDTVRRMKGFADIVAKAAFALRYQPIVDLATGGVHHYEVLARFEGEKSPFAMIQFAENIGMIERFDLAVLLRSLDVVKEAVLPPVAINVSGQSIVNRSFLECQLEILDQHRSLQGRIAFEITESAQIEDLAAANQAIQELRRRGFPVYLDDFGAGATSFQYLQALAVDGIKIDGAYVKRIGQSTRDDALLRGLVRLCSDLGVATVAEMIETEAQAQALRAMGVGYGQGWLFGRPDALPRR